MTNRRAKRIVVEESWKRHLSNDDQEYKVEFILIESSEQLS